MYQNESASVAKPYYAGSPMLSPTASTVDRVLLLDDEISKIHGATERLGSLIDAARSIADSVFGSQPPQESKATGQLAGYAGRANGLRTATSTLHDTIAVLESEIARLRAL
jgi:uncharacterized small protein (DUF1192 family)